MAAALPFIAMAATAGGSILKGLSSAGQANYESQVARNNAVIEQQNAGRSASAGAVEAETSGLKARSQLSGVRASLAANGVDVNSGSSAAVQESQRMLGTLSQQEVSNQAAGAVYGYETKAVSDQAEAKLYASEVAPDIAGGVLSAVGSIASMGSNLPGGGGGGVPSGTSDTGGGTAGSVGPGSDPTSLVNPSAGSGLGDDYSWMQSAGSADMVFA